MKVYDIQVQYFEDKIYSVVAKDKKTARKLFTERYPYVRIENILLHTDKVIIER